MRRYIQAEIKFSDFCNVQTNIVEYFVENIIYIYFPLFCFIVKSKHYRMHFYIISQVSNPDSFYINCTYDTVCLPPPPPPLLTSIFASYDTTWYFMFIDTDRKTVKHTNTEKSWRGMSKDKFYMFSVSNRCRMGYRQIPVNRNLIQIHAQILNFNQFKFIMYRQTYLKHQSCIHTQRAFLSTRKYSVKWNISTVICIVSNPPPPFFML